MTSLSHPRFSLRWFLIGWIFVISTVAYLDRVNISIAGQAIAAEFHLSDVQLGWVFSSFVVGYALFQAPGGWLADRFGARAILGLAVVWWAIFTSLIVLLPPGIAFVLPLLIAVRFILGMGEAVMYPASNCIVAAWILPAERGLANGIIFAGVGFGAGITPPLITYLLLHYGWRACFLASALLGLAAGAVWYVIARDAPSKHPWASPQEVALLESELHTAHPAAVEEPATLTLRAILSNRDVLAITFSYFCFGYAAYIFFSWFFIYLSKVRGLNLRESSYYTMLPFLAMAAGSSLGGWISDRLTRRFGLRIGRSLFSTGVLTMAAVFTLIGTQVESAKLASFVLAGGAGSLYLSQSCFWSMSADIGGRSSGLVSGVMNMGGQVGGALTASLTPLIAKSFGWPASFQVAAGLCALGAVAWLPVSRGVTHTRQAEAAIVPQAQH